MTRAAEDVAIVGMACLFPGAADLRSYWQNILDKKSAISDPPEDWGGDSAYDPESDANDRVYCSRGGYLGDLDEAVHAAGACDGAVDVVPRVGVELSLVAFLQTLHVADHRA